MDDADGSAGSVDADGAAPADSDDPLARYRPIVDDYEAFRAAVDRPLGIVVRVNAIKTDRETVEAAFDEAGIAHDRVDLHPRLLAVDTDSPGANWPYVHGWTYPQEEVSALPAVVLDPAPGDRVLAACAAPGGKATQAAAMMDDRGRLLANDRSLGRLSSLRSNAQRLGVTNVVVTNRDAREYTLAPFGFDAVDGALVDVPCSCEGTVRKNPDALDEWSLDRVEGIADTQRAILRRAVELTRPGGTVVYSTCTFAPEENEAVLDAVLGEGCEAVDPDLPEELSYAPGVREWNGREFHPGVRRAARIYPHHNDTGGFFCAKLRVT